MDVLLMGQRRAKSPAPGGIRNHNLSATRHVLYHCAKCTAMNFLEGSDNYWWRKVEKATIMDESFEKKRKSPHWKSWFLLNLLLSCLWDVALVWNPVFFNMCCSLSQARQVACSYCSLPSIRACQFAIMPALGLQGSGCETRHREPKELTH